MSAVSWDEMEAKRQEMIASFRQVADSMSRCVKVIEEFSALSPTAVTKPHEPIAPLTPGGSFAVSLANGLNTNSGIVLGQGIPAAALKKDRKKKEKKVKDPNAPKRPPSAYILYQNEVREDIRNNNAGMPYKEVLGIVASKWKELSEDQKKIYEDAYQSALASFRAEEAAYAKKGSLAADSDDDSDDSSSEDSTPTTTAPLVSAPVPTLAAAAPASDKKEKKRKSKEDEANAALSTPKDKKKKKKSKDAKE
ncbi:hypothetical protein IAT38_004042 [Cryptococcus sp. DSM 104549]